jgi:cytoskeleton protein RodZ
MAAEERVEGASALSPASPAGPGARLQAARHAAGLSLEQVAQQLKLAPRQVRALEEEDFAQLPGRTFARGFVRNYARLLNLDGEDLLATLPDATRAPALEAPALQSTGAMIAELPSASTVRPSVTRWVIPLVLVACIVGAATYEWYRGGLSPQDAAPRTLPPTAGVASPEVGAAPSAATPSAMPAPTAAAAPATTTSTELPNPFAVEAAATAVPAAARAANPEAAAAPVSAMPAPAEAVAPPASLQLTYRGPSWTEIRDRDGQVLISRLVAAGSEQSIRGVAPFDIVIGNATVVTLVYRGAPVDLLRYTRQNVARLRLT